MHKKDIREAYMRCIEPRILDAEEYAGDTWFDKLMAVCNSSQGYSLFYPMTPEFASGCGGVEFDALVELYRRIRYCWDDDGTMSFVHSTTVCGYPVIRGKSTKLQHAFVMAGAPEELSWPIISKWALTHDSSNGYLLSYRACAFEQEVLTYLHGWLPDWSALAELGHTAAGSASVFSYFQKHSEMYAQYEQFIRARQRGDVLYNGQQPAAPSQ